MNAQMISKCIYAADVKMLPKTHVVQNRELSLGKIFLKELRHFCLETDLHGWKFVVLKKSTILEKLVIIREQNLSYI